MYVLFYGVILPKRDYDSEMHMIANRNTAFVLVTDQPLESQVVGEGGLGVGVYNYLSSS